LSISFQRICELKFLGAEIRNFVAEKKTKPDTIGEIGFE